MKVLHINANYITSALHQTMMNHFSDRIENTVFAPTFDVNRCIIKPNPNVIVAECFKKWDRLFFFYKQRKIRKAVLERVDIRNVDVIHAYTLFTDGNIAYYLAKKFKKPYVVAIRNTDVNDFFKKMIHLRPRGLEILKNADAVFFLSSVYEETVIENYVPQNMQDEIRAKSYIIPNGIDDFWHHNIYLKDVEKSIERICETKEINCLYAGIIDANKNIELTLKALELLKLEGWKCKLTAVGRIADKRVFSRLEAYDFFDYFLPQEKENLISYYRDSDVFIMPSHTETFGLVYAEAMSQGLPVIYTRGQGFDGQFEEGIVGYSVSDNDAVELKNKILCAVNHLKELSSNSVNVVNRYDWNLICKQYEKIYSEIIS